MENNDTGFALGFNGCRRSEMEERELMEEYRARKANADRIEAAIMTACKEIADRLERDAKNMTNKEIGETISAMAGIAAILGALNMYAAKPYTSVFGCV